MNPSCLKRLIQHSVAMANKKIMCLFDVDGTLTASRQIVRPDVEKFLLETVRKEFDIGLVGGSDFAKICEQMGGNDVVNRFKYVFAENGLVAFQDGKRLITESILDVLGEDQLQEIINFALRYIADLRIPTKRGTFIEFRTGLINISPIGRNCSREERIQFEEYDKEHQIRRKFIQALKKEFPDLPLTMSIGGQISIDLFPNGWDKTYCLKYIQGYDEIHFFGDRTEEGGNDHEIYESDLTIGHRVTSPDDTLRQLKILIALEYERKTKGDLSSPVQLL
ncbi:phosphomannomutase isoform X1 [Athalia rosae]|uniref:phosphomannomutase isoform X1 n=2 Tax=Athalia rosae TaxID=37344 RepID=UPI0020342812|nr:phosphomannomutase isoform X1 [Athalia rosae]